MTAKPYSTLVATHSEKKVTSLAAKAKAHRRATAASAQRLTSKYGTAMSSVVTQKYRPVGSRTAAAVAGANAAVEQAAAAVTAAKQSNVINNQVAGAMAEGQKGVLERVRQGAEPGFISARSAMAEAKAYANRIGIEMKTMNWEAKAALFGQIIQTNNSMLMAQFQSQLQLDTQQKLFRLQQKETQRAELAGASQVVNSVSNSMPLMLNAIQESTATEGTAIAEEAAAFAASVTADTNEQKTLAAIYQTVALGAEQHTTNGVLDGNWVRQVVTSSVHSMYQSYTGEGIADILSDSLMGSMLGSDNVSVTVSNAGGTTYKGSTAPKGMHFDQWGNLISDDGLG